MELTIRSTTIKYIIAVLITVGLLSLVPQNTPAKFNKQVDSTISTSKVTAVVKTASKPEQPQPEIQTAVVTTPVATPVVAPQPTTHEELMAAAGISPADYGAADYIVSHESGWNSDATEPNSGAHGLPQALPYSKTGCGWDDAVCQLSWANTYAISRYGGWWNAYSYWSANHNW